MASLLLVVLFCLSLSVGPAGLLPARPILALRLVRACIAVAAGATLAVNGCALQAFLLNPLADPYVLGISGGAAFGYAVALLFGMRTASFLSLPAALGGLCAFALVYLLARRGGKLPPGDLILAGILMSFLFTSLVFILLLARREGIHRVLYVLWGYLGIVIKRGEVVHFALMLAVLAGLNFWIFALSRELDVLSLGETEALSVGVNVERVRKLLFGLTSVSTGLLVSAVGSIGFVGLMVPHLARMLVVSSHRVLLPVSALLGASLLLLSDLLSRSITPYELPVGVITSLMGVPFFLYLLTRRKSGSVRV